MKAIDHGFYPHIVDNVIKYADLTTLNRFRRASKHYKKKVGALLSAIIIDMTEPNLDVSDVPALRVSSAVGDLERLLLGNNLFTRSWDDTVKAIEEETDSLLALG